MITCVGWIRRGVAKAVPDKVALSKEEIQEIIDEAKEKLRQKEAEENGAESSGVELDEDVSKAKRKTKKSRDDDDNDDDDEEISDLYDLAHYDSDEDVEGELMSGAGMAGVTYFASNKDDPYITLANPDQDEDEEEDFKIKPDDNLLVAGHVDEDFSSLEISVYNEEEGSQYVHHDIILEAFPLTIEWLDYDPEDTNKPDFQKSLDVYYGSTNDPRTANDPQIGPQKLMILDHKGSPHRE
ncbi:Periodic tryptophan protein 1-like [Stylophora pistillata]|uniref:Periodic tryptophan protein 1-like n=1 Tax=Stylophora pistillata TaxID=50429 RepID=A0A2B4SGV0_STYPI|nr:Periodic tryptophan protein 1-like [Stylophora pistillata]